MKIVTRETFLTLPAGTAFTKIGEEEGSLFFLSSVSVFDGVPGGWCFDELKGFPRGPLELDEGRYQHAFDDNDGTTYGIPDRAHLRRFRKSVFDSNLNREDRRQLRSLIDRALNVAGGSA